METLCCCQPESSFGLLFFLSASHTLPSASIAIFSLLFFGIH